MRPNLPTPPSRRSSDCSDHFYSGIVPRRNRYDTLIDRLARPDSLLLITDVLGPLLRLLETAECLVQAPAVEVPPAKVVMQGDEPAPGVRPLLTVAIADNAVGQIRLDRGDNDAAAHLFTDGLAVARRAQDWVILLTSLYDLALARQAQGDLAGAAGYLQDGLALAAQAGDETSAAYYLEVLAAVAGLITSCPAAGTCAPRLGAAPRRSRPGPRVTRTAWPTGPFRTPPGVRACGKPCARPGRRLATPGPGPRRTAARR
jgi:hypothetical protein